MCTPPLRLRLLCCRKLQGISFYHSRFTGSIPSAWFAPGGMEALQAGGLPVVRSLWIAAALVLCSCLAWQPARACCLALRPVARFCAPAHACSPTLSFAVRVRCGRAAQRAAARGHEQQHDGAHHVRCAFYGSLQQGCAWLLAQAAQPCAARSTAATELRAWLPTGRKLTVSAPDVWASALSHPQWKGTKVQGTLPASWSKLP